MNYRSQYVPLAWYNSGYAGITQEPQQLVWSAETTPPPPPPPPYTERDPSMDQKYIHPALRYQANEKRAIYASVKPSLARLKTAASDFSAPTSPISPRSFAFSKHEDAPSLISDTSSIRSDYSISQNPITVPCSPRTLRRAGRRARGMSLRDLRQKQSEADLQKAYTSSVEDYLSGYMFSGFQSWREERLVEDT